jgi:Uma2 family endonuclease
MSAQPIPFLTPEEYLAIERKAEIKSEYHRGTMYAMRGNTIRHVKIVRNLVVRLDEATRHGYGEVFSTDLKLWVEAEQLYAYPDLMIICGPLAIADNFRDTVTNPSIIIEVLSPSTEAYDRGKKFSYYQEVASLQEYVLVSQDEARVERFTRQADGTWVPANFVGLESSLPLAGIDCQVPLATIYDRVDFSSV